LEIIEAIRSRKSVRGYRPDPVPKEILREILEIATRSPSAMNTQPWEITVIAGKALDDVRRGNVEMLTSGIKPESNVLRRPFEGVYRQRQEEASVLSNKVRI